jgi:hypothetical protein
MPRGINNYPNAEAIYANPKWTHYSPYMKNVVVLFNKNKNPFFIKNGTARSFNVKANENGATRMYYGSGPYNYLMNTPENTKNTFAHFTKFKNQYRLAKRRPVLNTVPAYKIRMVRKAANNKKKAEAAKRVNKLANNARAGRNISKASLSNLLLLVMRYQNANAGSWYSENNKGRVTRNGNKGPEKPTRKQLLNNINNMREYNYGLFSSY